MKLFFKTSFLSFLFIGIWISSCTKDDALLESSQSESIQLRNDEPEYEESIVAIDLDVEVIDGVLSFETQSDWINTMRVLNSNNLESIIAWEQEQGFKSLFTEWVRIDELEDHQEKLDALQEGRLEHLLAFHGNELDIMFSDFATSMTYNNNGLVMVNGYIGTIGNGLNIWTIPSKKNELISALNNGNLPSDPDFIIIDGTAFGGENSIEPRVAVEIVTDCPLDASFSTDIERLENSSGKRSVLTN